MYPEFRSSQKLSAKGRTQKIAAKGVKSLAPKGADRSCMGLNPFRDSHIFTSGWRINKRPEKIAT
jgi:hypothetical protein